MAYRVATAGWSVPATEHKGDGASHLVRYARVFGAVEINTSFYRPHRRTTYERWAKSVPAPFRFSVKLPQSITHEAGLVGCGAQVEQFCDSVAGLGRKLAVVLVQLPPSLEFQARVARTLFGQLQRRLQASLACEARHRSWFTPRADRLFASLQVARVVADPPIVQEMHTPRNGRLCYHRLHGTPRMYYSSYSAAELQGVAQTLRALRSRSVWCVFDNTASGAAWPNAVTLQKKLRQAASSPRRKDLADHR